LLGGDAIAGFCIGLNLVGLHMIVVSLIAGHSLRNAREWTESKKILSLYIKF